MKPLFSYDQMAVRAAVTVIGSCWVWIGNRTPQGYARPRHAGRLTLAHRLAWALFNGPIPKGKCVLHRCDNPPCCNPDHLFLGSKGDNNRDRNAKGRQAKGPLIRTARLTPAQVREIRTSTASHVSLARKFGVLENAIYHVRNRKSWRHVA